MEAKDTVMEDTWMDMVVPSVLFGGRRGKVDVLEKIQAQAEVTWDIAEKEGMKKVVEWMNENCLGCSTNTPCNTDKYLGLDEESWQVQLKEWGL